MNTGLENFMNFGLFGPFFGSNLGRNGGGGGIAGSQIFQF